ncbi:MAG: hypothetical protein LBQ00_02510 [Syntrophobacterales bacterium]|nr:hypothetical protein [Syntrophobacterales bacterium]
MAADYNNDIDDEQKTVAAASSPVSQVKVRDIYSLVEGWQYMVGSCMPVKSRKTE